MSAVTNLWSQLVQRRLWPVAILLIAALVGVPLALSKQPAAAPEAPLPVAKSDGKNELANTPVVAAVNPGDPAKRRRVLGTAKNPFAVAKPAQATTPTTQPNTDGTGTSATPNPAGSTPSGTGGGVTTPTPGGGTPLPTTPPKKPKVYALYELTVRFGDSSASPLPKHALKRLQPLPSAEDPLLIYMGVLKDGKTAVFLVDSGVEPTGDGECKPAPAQCETIQLRAGETEFFDVKDDTGAVVGQYELDLVTIHQGATTSAKRARTAYAGSKSGRRVLRARSARRGPSLYRLNGLTGTIARRSLSALPSAR
jgi:hypothetical protein